MTSDGWQIGRLLGVPVVLARSWFVIAAVVTFLFAPSVQRVAPELGVGSYVVAFGFAVLLFASVLVHELAHAVAARATGLPATRIVLNLWGGHTQFDTEATSPGRSLLVAVVGPASNAVLAMLAYPLVAAVDPGSLAGLLVLAFVLTNAFVAVFNAIPGLPLDGGRVLEAAVWRLSGNRHTGTIVAGWAGRLVAVAVGVWALVLPLLSGRSPDLITVVWAVLVGGMLWSGASAAIAHASVRRRVPDVVAARLVVRAVGVPASATVADAVSAARAAAAVEVVLLAPDGSPVGLLDRDAVSHVPSGRAAQVPASSAARALDPRAVVDVRLSGEAMMRTLAGLPGDTFVALDPGGTVVGVLHAADVLAAVAPRRRAP